MELNENQLECLRITQEEAAEVIQAISKVLRFGMDGVHPERTETNGEHLEEELGDILAMVDILMEVGVASWGNVNAAKRRKFEKLKRWSNIVV
jgi:NTP pyrophosphatase (non-canonical NTP hydrolase)